MIKYRKTDHPKWKWELTEAYTHTINQYDFGIVRLLKESDDFICTDYIFNG